MSLDLSLTAVRPTLVFDSNITHNLGRMAREAGLYDALWDSHGALAATLIDDLKWGLMDLVGNADKYRALAPANGWGSYEGLVQFTQEFYNACVANPDATVGVCK